VIPVALALIVALLAPITFRDPGCPSVEIVGVRGSGQIGYGEQVQPVVEALHTALVANGRTVESSPLEYTAISVSDSFGFVLLNGEYDRSVTDGVSALRSTLDAIASTCRTTDIVLVAYSQGAQVVKVALEESAPIHRVASIVLLADPTRHIAQRGIARLGDATVERNGTFGAIALPDYLRAVTIDVCAAGDGICERGRRSFTAHIDGYSGVASEIVPLVLAEFEGRASGVLRVA
jgi:hypothetical protein